MDDIVRQALVKWPQVPACYGWLGLDARGNWFMRDAQVQALGPFGGGTRQSRGALLKHEKLIEFIGRNYQPDAQGQWYFQNGPQRVYVELEATPWIWRVNADLSVRSHTGALVLVQNCLQDELGRVYLATDCGFGLVHSLDVIYVAEAVERARWSPQDVLGADLPTLFNYVASPQLLQLK